MPHPPAARHEPAACLSPRPVVASKVVNGLHAELSSKGMPIHATGLALHAASAALRQQFARSLSPPLQAVLAPPASEADMATVLLSAGREDRKVRLALCIAPVDSVAESLACASTTPSDMAPAAPRATRLGSAVHLLEFQLTRKDQFAEESEEEASHQEEAVFSLQGSADTRLAALEASTVARLHAALQAALVAFDVSVDFQNLRGIDAAVAAVGTGAKWASALQLQRAVILALADRNHIEAHSCIPQLLDQPLPQVAKALSELGAAAPFEPGDLLPPPPTLFWDRRWESKQSRVSYAAFKDQDSDDDEQEHFADENKFVPFGSVIAASGRSVRVTVSTSAGLAAELPIWGIRMRADAEWAVRALRPDRAIVLREGEHALVQAELLDADGKGVPSSERLLRAVLFATPALAPELQRAVDLQRDGSLVPAQQGQKAPLLMPKREAFTELQH